MTLTFAGALLSALGAAVLSTRAVIAYVTGEELAGVRAATGVTLAGLTLIGFGWWPA